MNKIDNQDLMSLVMWQVLTCGTWQNCGPEAKSDRLRNQICYDLSFFVFFFERMLLYASHVPSLINLTR